MILTTTNSVIRSNRVVTESLERRVETGALHKNTLVPKPEYRKVGAEGLEPRISQWCIPKRSGFVMRANIPNRVEGQLVVLQ